MKSSLDRTLKERGFAAEKDLVSLIRRLGKRLPRVMSWRERRALLELDVAFGRADLVFFNLLSNWENALLIGKVPPKWAFALRKLPRTFDVDGFCAVTGASKKNAINMLRMFESVGFCERDGTRWRKVQSPRRLVSRIVAIEAKLRNWKRALAQATRYREYANESWVVLDQRSSKPALANVEQFKRLNVGLASIDRQGALKLHFVPERGKPQSPVKFWHANAAIAARLSTDVALL